MLKLKKVCVLILALFIVLTMGACIKKKTADTNNPGQNTTPTPTAETTPTPGDDGGNSGKSGEITNILDEKGTIDNYLYECEIFSSGMTMKYNLWKSGPKSRLDMDLGTGLICIYDDTSKNEAYMYDPTQKTAMKTTSSGQQDYMKPGEFLGSVMGGDLSLYAKKGKTTIEGMSCQAYEYKYENNRVTIYVWDKYNAVVKMETYIGDKLENYFFLKKYETGTVTDDMVTLPAGTQITDLTGQQ